MNFEEENKSIFDEYIVKILRFIIPCKTKNISNFINCRFVLQDNLNIVLNYLKDNNINYTFSYVESNIIMILYLKEYEYTEDYYKTKQYLAFEKLTFDTENWFINNEKIDIKNKFVNRSARKEDISLFPKLNKIDYFYFVFDTNNTNLIKAILKDKLDLSVKICNIDIMCEEYGINGLSYFEIHEDWFRCSKSLCNAIANILHISNLSYCLYKDVSGKQSLSNHIILKQEKNNFYRLDLKNAFRSPWEANIARILNYYHISWEYEKTSFPRYNKENKATGVYYPDFFLDNYTILEVKGFWNPESRNKAKEFQEHYSEYKYYIIDGDMYYTLDKLYNTLIPEWEAHKSTILKEEKLQVVGLSFGTRKQTCDILNIGNKVKFKRDSQNVYDPNAILVLTDDNREIGFVSSDWAVIYAPKIDLGMTFDAEIASIEPKVINIKVKRNNPEEEIIYDFLK